MPKHKPPRRSETINKQALPIKPELAEEVEEDSGRLQFLNTMNDRKQHLTEQRTLAQSMTAGRVASVGEYLREYGPEVFIVVTACFGKGDEFRVCSGHGDTMEAAIERLHADSDRRLSEIRAAQPIEEVNTEALHD